MICHSFPNNRYNRPFLAAFHLTHQASPEIPWTIQQVASDGSLEKKDSDADPPTLLQQGSVA